MADNFKHVNKYLSEYGKSVVSEMRTRLEGNDKVASGKLSKSIKFEKKELEVVFKMADYGKFVDKGVQGSESNRAGKGGKSEFKFKSKMPPEKSILNWMKIKGIPKKYSYPIRRNIFKFGITPTNFFTLTVNRRQKQFEKGLEKAILKDIEDNIK
jgi:hypothetical protein